MPLTSSPPHLPLSLLSPPPSPFPLLSPPHLSSVSLRCPPPYPLFLSPQPQGHLWPFPMTITNHHLKGKAYAFNSSCDRKTRHIIFFKIYFWMISCHHPCKWYLWCKWFTPFLNVISIEQCVSGAIIKHTGKHCTACQIAIFKPLVNHCWTLSLQTSIKPHPKRIPHGSANFPTHPVPYCITPQLCQWSSKSLCYLHEALWGIWIFKPCHLRCHGFLNSSPERSSPIVLLSL